MSDVEVGKPKARRKAKAAPKLPTVLDAEITRIAGEIVAERNAEARRVAALELAGRLLAQAIDLLHNAGGGVGHPVGTQLRTAPKPPERPCTWCGAVGIRKGPGGGWLCPTHAAVDLHERREEALAGPGLMGALRAARVE